jgi:hypothetical protein
MNKKRKGSRNVAIVVAALVNKGWVVADIERKGRFIKHKDAFGLFDLVAVKQGEVYFVQVTSTRPHTHKPYISWAVKNHLVVCQFVVINKKGVPPKYERYFYTPAAQVDRDKGVFSDETDLLQYRWI